MKKPTFRAKKATYRRYIHVPTRPFALVITLWLLPFLALCAQDSLFLTGDTDLLLALPEPEEPVISKKKEFPPNMFFGLRVSRKSIKSKHKRHRIKERFYHLRKKHKEEIPPYVPYVYWYSASRKRIMYTSRNAPRNGPLLHGLYQKMWEKDLIEERYFYHGVAHKRWIWWNTAGILRDKRYYHKGWSRDAVISYHDGTESQIRNILPVQHGERSGPYYAFHLNGDLALIGAFSQNARAGSWREYYESGQIKREMQYGAPPAYISREWARDGTLIYQSTRKKKK